jgi:hypothetical protein
VSQVVDVVTNVKEPGMMQRVTQVPNVTAPAVDSEVRNQGADGDGSQ